MCIDKQSEGSRRKEPLLLRIMGDEWPCPHWREALIRSLKYEEGWLEELISEVGTYAVAHVIESLCLSLGVCQEKLAISERRQDE